MFVDVTGFVTECPDTVRFVDKNVTSWALMSEESPCINVCTLDEDGEYCTACGQTIQELMK